MEYFKNRKIAKLLKKAAKQGVYSAIDTYNKILEINPDLPAVYNYIGLCYFELTDYEKAKKYFHDAIEKFTEDFKSQYEVYYNLAFSYHSLDEAEQAEKYYKMSMNLNKDYKFVYKNYGYLLFNLKRYKEALDMFEKYNSFGEEAEVFNNIGIIYEELNDNDKAIEYYEKAIKIDDKYALAYNNLGALYMSLKNYKKAAELFDSAIKHDVSLTDAYNNLATVFTIDEKYNAALALYEKALKINPRNIIILINKAKLHMKLNDLTNVVNTLKNVLKYGYSIDKIIKIEEFKNIDNLENLLTEGE